MKKRKPIFHRILFLLMVLTIVEISILVFTFVGQGLIEELNRNEREVLASKVYARKNYLESIMIHDWMDVDDTVEGIVALTEDYLAEASLTLQEMEGSAQHTEALLTQTIPPLISMMRDNRVTGAYIILNTTQIRNPDALPDRPGVYLRDEDPTSLSFERNEDILLKVSPVEAVRTMQLPTDSDWDMYFRFQERDMALRGSVCDTLQMAWSGTEHYHWSDLGHWSIPGTREEILTYTVPLILADGSVLGVLGVDITFRYLTSLLPWQELGFGEDGAYILARYDAQQNCFYDLFGSRTLTALEAAGEKGCRLDESYYASIQNLRLYNTNTPFSSHQWVIAGIARKQAMHEFANDLMLAVTVAVSITLLIGILVSFLISYLLQKPIVQVARDLEAADPKHTLQLRSTGILEIDAITDAVMKLSQQVLENGQLFSKIVEMSSVRMTAFRIELSTGKLFLSENFFAIFAGAGTDQEDMTLEAFRDAMTAYARNIIQRDDDRGMYMLFIAQDGQSQYIRLRYHEAQGFGYGLLEDVTQEVLERQLLQHERDHDSLTGLLNRRAFRAQVIRLLELPAQELKRGAMVMVDLDNLKYMNDSYGHDYGDRYIIQAANALKQSTGDRGICARISGDEFNAFLYGFDSEAELDAQIRLIQERMNSSTVALPDEGEQVVHATGGVARFPEHSRSIENLSKYADYAMYIAKRSKKRSFQYFNPAIFYNPDIRRRNSEMLTRMLQYQLVHYAFQPIVDARTGSVFAYEALMRPEVAPYFTVGDVLDTARRDGKLEQVEELTLFKTLEAFTGFLCSGVIGPDTHLFVNSIPSTNLSYEKGVEFVREYRQYMCQVVLELTEEERLSKEIWDSKQGFHRSLGGKIALDDYGSGYNSEKMLLDISPDFIKVDMSIIRDIHLSTDKQAIVSNIVRYAHERGKFIIAEGVETLEEVQQLVVMDVDYMQGYYFGKPQRMPEDIHPQTKTALLSPR